MIPGGVGNSNSASRQARLMAECFGCARRPSIWMRWARRRLLPQGRAREMSLALSPRGEIDGVDIAVTHETKRGWRLNGGAKFHGLSIGASSRFRGMTGISGSIAGAGDHAAGELTSSG
jgi:hypothetical protein